MSVELDFRLVRPGRPPRNRAPTLRQSKERDREGKAAKENRGGAECGQGQMRVECVIEGSC